MSLFPFCRFSQRTASETQFVLCAGRAEVKLVRKAVFHMEIDIPPEKAEIDTPTPAADGGEQDRRSPNGPESPPTTTFSLFTKQAVTRGM